MRTDCQNYHDLAVQEHHSTHQDTTDLAILPSEEHQLLTTHLYTNCLAFLDILADACICMIWPSSSLLMLRWQGTCMHQLHSEQHTRKATQPFDWLSKKHTSKILYCLIAKHLPAAYQKFFRYARRPCSSFMRFASRLVFGSHSPALTQQMSQL